MPHYIENTGTTKLRYLELWESDHCSDVSLAQGLAFTPYELVRAQNNINKSVLSKVSTKKDAGGRALNRCVRLRREVGMISPLVRRSKGEPGAQHEDDQLNCHAR